LEDLRVEIQNILTNVDIIKLIHLYNYSLVLFFFHNIN
jgi:hypothetical protein